MCGQKSKINCCSRHFPLCPWKCGKVEFLPGICRNPNSLLVAAATVVLPPRSHWAHLFPPQDSTHVSSASSLRLRCGAAMSPTAASFTTRAASASTRSPCSTTRASAARSTPASAATTAAAPSRRLPKVRPVEQVGFQVFSSRWSNLPHAALCVPQDGWCAACDAPWRTTWATCALLPGARRSQTRPSFAPTTLTPRRATATTATSTSAGASFAPKVREGLYESVLMNPILTMFIPP